MIRKKHSLQNQLKPYNYHIRMPLSNDKNNSSFDEAHRFNPKLKVFKMVGLISKVGCQITNSKTHPTLV